jgi:hypothetical protein
MRAVRGPYGSWRSRRSAAEQGGQAFHSAIQHQTASSPDCPRCCRGRPVRQHLLAVAARAMAVRLDDAMVAAVIECDERPRPDRPADC